MFPKGKAYLMFNLNGHPYFGIDEKIRLWDEIDKQIRERLAMAANDYPDLRQDVKQFSESLFLKIDL